MTTGPTDTTWITVEEMQRTLKLGKNKVFAILASGQVDAIKIGRSVRVNSDSLQRFISQHPYKPDDRARREAPSVKDRT